MHASELWAGRSAKARLAQAALTPLSWVYAAGWQAYLGIYRLGLKKAEEPHRPVIVVGNLAVGGSGKTPATLCIAELLRGMGREVVIGCSGYGSPKAEAASLAPEGKLDPREWGDEPAMIRRLLPNVPLVVGRRRVLAARLVHQCYPNAVLLMDDGFQHLPLRKHVSVVLDDPEPVNDKCLPAGPYREPRRNISRANLVVWNRPWKEGFQMIRSPLHLESLSGRSGQPQEAALVCALARPEALVEELGRMLDLRVRVLLPDHDPLTSPHLFESVPKELPIVVTLKDWVKLANRTDLRGREIWLATQEVTIEPKEDFRQWLQGRLDESS